MMDGRVGAVRQQKKEKGKASESKRVNNRYCQFIGHGLVDVQVPFAMRLTKPASQMWASWPGSYCLIWRTAFVACGVSQAYSAKYASAFYG